jgi:integrase
VVPVWCPEPGVVTRWCLMSRLTIARIEAAKPPQDGSEIKLWDGAVAGLYLRVFAGGSRSWVYRYRADGGGRGAKLRTIKLGNYPGLTLDAAREAAKAYVGAVAKGQDPALLRQETRRRGQATLGHLLAVDGPYERALRARHIVNTSIVLSCLRRGLQHLMGSDIAKLSRRDVVEALDRLSELPGAQTELRKHTRVLLEWAVNSGLAHANVMAGMRLPPRTRAEKLKQTGRRRAFSDPDIVALWRAADGSKFGALVRLGILTGMRRGELGGLRWSDIQADRIVLAPEVTKMAARHEIPLTPLMREILDGQPKTTSPLIFPSDVTGRKLAAWGRLKARLVQDTGIGAWTIHDTRRTTRTLMSRLGVTETAAEAAIGHAKAALIAIYDHDTQWNARVDAFQRVSDHIKRLVD